MHNTNSTLANQDGIGPIRRALVGLSCGNMTLLDSLVSTPKGQTEPRNPMLAALITLQGAPHYFRRAGKGRYRKAPPEVLAQALAAIEKKKQVQAQIEAWSAELVAGRCPEPIRDQLYRILFKPDKNAPE